MGLDLFLGKDAIGNVLLAGFSGGSALRYAGGFKRDVGAFLGLF